MTSTTMHEETIKVLINVCYGGFALSPETIKLYNERCSPEKKISLPSEGMFACRDDPILIQIFEEIGSARFGAERGTKIIAVEIPKKYEDFYRIKEYDGKETLSVDQNIYNLWRVKQIAFDENKSAEEKINEIKNILL